MGTYATVEVGITTGANGFFTVPKSIIDKYNLSCYAMPLVGRSVQVNSLIFTKQDWLDNQTNNAKANLLVFPKINKLKSNKKALEYLKQGESQNIHKGYKCRIREEWQIVPSIKVSDALFIRRNNLHPKLVGNEAGAFTTDTMHRVFAKNGTNINALVSSYYNSLSFAFSEIAGRSYGGGVLELMPNEVEEILLPYKSKHEKILGKLDVMLRKKQDIESVLDYSDSIILKRGFGFSNKEIDIARSIWRKLSQRRLNRK
jgi:adenine-specific DNA methylase